MAFQNSYDAWGMSIKAQILQNDDLSGLLSDVAEWVKSEHLRYAVTNMNLSFAEDMVWEMVVYYDEIVAREERHLSVVPS